MKAITLLLIILGAVIICAPAMADYCNIVQSGSSFDGSRGSFTSDLGSRFAGASPVETSYTMQVNGGNVPAIGMLNSYFSGSFSEGDVSRIQRSYTSFSQYSRAIGQIYKYDVSYSYRSGLSGYCFTC